jgi:hypothetical protein
MYTISLSNYYYASTQSRGTKDVSFYSVSWHSNKYYLHIYNRKVQQQIGGCQNTTVQNPS